VECELSLVDRQEKDEGKAGNRGEKARRVKSETLSPNCGVRIISGRTGKRKMKGNLETEEKRQEELSLKR